MAFLTCHLNSIKLFFPSPQQHWRCSYSFSCLPNSSFLPLRHKPTSKRISVAASVVVEDVAGGRMERALPTSRRQAGVALMALVCIFVIQQQSSAHARQRRNTKAVAIQDYKTTNDGIKYYDLVEGNGPEAKKGSTAVVHFDCIYKGLTVVSSRESKILAGNRVIAQPYEFIVGATPGKERKREFVDNPNGLFSAQAAPKPPAALYAITEGMHVGGQRTVIVTPEVGYGKKGMNEIPPDGSFELNIELLEVKTPASSK